MTQVAVSVPLTLTAEMTRAVREDPTTKAEDWETWHTRLGWLICAWDVLLQARPRTNTSDDMVQVPREALQWLFGEVGFFEPLEGQPPKGAYWWRSEFRRRAGLQEF